MLTVATKYQLHIDILIDHGCDYLKNEPNRARLANSGPL